ncbi:hypothetical protein LN042_21050 [Kitasatospora sp. RB6PN24]|uniref:hypothetical protein n=1 Tax=Kitasatospora humi TaxID=2893891 RepID=UPI001E3346CF|nr:hypothetical protein [Kitasatospora humi]MCC9309534.1 hypothetical protein [Kitasatospora humi]
MTTHRGLVRLYPAAFRDRWGPGLEDDARAAGWKGWPSLLAGIADMWLHPAIWPADSRAQRRERVATLGVTATMVAVLLARAATARGVPLVAVPGGALVLWPCTALLLLGLGLVAPLPRLSRPAVTAVLGRAVRRLAGPVVVGAAMVAAAHRYAAVLAGGFRHQLMLTGYWGLLVVGAVQACRVVAGLGVKVVVAPRVWRLRLGIASLTAASALTGSVALAVGLARPQADRPAIAAGGALVLLAWALAATLRDLRETVAD